MWFAQIFARCPALLQFLHTTSAATLQSFREWTVLPHRLHFPWKNASASSFCHSDAMSSQLLPELWGAALGDEYHSHDFLLRDVV